MRLFVFAALAASGVGSSALANIVSNGDFEVPVITAPFRVVPAGDDFITGWTVTAPAAGQGVDLVNAPAQGNLDYAHTGNQSIDMAGTPGRGTIYQDLATVAGTWYRVEFWLSTNGGFSASSLTLEWDGSPVSTLSSPGLGKWERHEFDLLASSATTRLAFIGNIDGNSSGALLDTVSVVEIPSPGVLTIAGLAGATGLRRRR